MEEEFSLKHVFSFVGFKELMDEGRKLSLQLGNANTALRKLRAKEKEGTGSVLFQITINSDITYD